VTPAPAATKRAWIVATLGALGLVGLVLLVLDRRLGSQIEEISGALGDQRVHVEVVTSLWRDCRKSHDALLERWLPRDDARNVRGRRLAGMVADVRRSAAALAALPPTSPEEQEARARLTSAVADWSRRLDRAIANSEGPSALDELQTTLDRVDLWADRVVEANSAAGNEAAAQLRALHDRRTTGQVAFVAAIAGIAVLAAWWRGRVRAETRDLEAARRAQERAASVRSEFFANMSHELRTPLVAIAGFGAVIEQRPGIDGETRETVQLIQREAKDLLGIINNILDLAKLESNHAQFRIEQVSLEEILERCVTRCQGLVGQKPIDIKVEIASGLPPVRGDFVKLVQVFTNLLGNAIKFTERGRVVVRARPEEGDVGQRRRASNPHDEGVPARVIVEVEDTGVGIRPEAVKTIWEPFRQADHQVSRRFGGTGLGLSIVRTVVTRLGGTVHVESTVGVGTTFTVVLPAGPGPSPAGVHPGRQDSAAALPASV